MVSGVVYIVTTGWDFCDVGQSPVSVQWGAFFRFDTSNLPDHCTVTSVQFRVRGYRASALGEPQDYEIRLSVGDIIGGTLDGNSGEWNAGTLMLTLDARPADKTTLDLSDDGNDPCPLVNISGDTDIKILDHSFHGTGDSSWTANFNPTTTERCKLYVYFSIPSAEVTGKGYASGSGEIVAAASGEATGEGASVGSGVALVDATSTVTGTGEATGEGTRTRLGVGEGTGVGSSSSDGDIVAAGTGVGTGVGYGTGIPEIITDATATVTGVGYATGVGGQVQAPMSLDSRSVSVSPTNSSTVSVNPVDSATISVDPEDSQTLTPRRLP